MPTLTWMTTRGDWEKYQSGRPNRLMSAVLVSYVSEQRVLRMLPPEQPQRFVRNPQSDHVFTCEMVSLVTF